MRGGIAITLPPSLQTDTPEEGSSGHPQSTGETEERGVEEQHGHWVVEHSQDKYGVDTVGSAREEHQDIGWKLKRLSSRICAHLSHEPKHKHITELLGIIL